MRNSFMDAVMEAALTREDVFIITGDAGLGVFDRFREERPERFLNLGVAEQNAMGFAAGLALTGLKVFVYNIIPFLLYRPYEQVRNDVCYQNLPVTLVGIGSGVAYAPAGMTHYAVEDLALARTLPNLTVLSPCDPAEAVAAARFALDFRGPLYVRLAKRGEPTFNRAQEIDVTRPQLLLDGGGAAMIFHGSIAEEVVKAREMLERCGITPKIISLPMVEPVDEAGLLGLLAEVDLVVTVEEHVAEGGLGSVLAGLKVRTGARWKLKSLGIPRRFIHEVGSAAHLRGLFGLDARAIAAALSEGP